MSNDNFKTSRILWIDSVKFFGILAIVLGHTILGGWLKHYVYSFHVPLFFFMMGVTSSLTKFDTKPFFQYVKKQAYSLLVPYYIFAVISTAIIFFVSLFVDFDEAKIFDEPVKLFTQILTGYCRANNPLWFLPCAFVMCTIAYLIVRSVNNIQASKVRIFIFVCIATAFGILMYLNYHYIGIHRIFYKTDSALELLPFFLIGYCFFEYNVSKKIESLNTYIKVPLAIALIILGAILGSINKEAAYLSSIYGNIAVFYLSAILSILGIIILCMTLRPLKLLTYCGARTITILLLHKFPILAFQRVIPFTSAYLENYSVPVGVAVALISIAVCCVIDVLIMRIAPFMIGKRKVK